METEVIVILNDGETYSVLANTSIAVVTAEELDKIASGEKSMADLVVQHEFKLTELFHS